MKSELIKILGILAIIAILVSMILAVLAMIGSVKLADGCFRRYDPDAKGGQSDSITNTVMLNATANYTTKATPSTSSAQGVSLEYDPTSYGKWLNIGLSVIKGQKVKFKIEGDISLCKAYVPQNNIVQPSDLDTQNNRIPIPRVEDEYADPLPLIFNAKTDGWRNIAELYYNDRVVVATLPNQKADQASAISIQVQNIFDSYKDGATYKNRMTQADCREGKPEYSPLCGRYSMYSGKYVSGCSWDEKCSKPENCVNKTQDHGTICCVRAIPYPHEIYCHTDESKCNAGDVGKAVGIDTDDYWTWWQDTCSRTQPYWKNEMRDAPEPYQDNGYFTLPLDQDINNVNKKLGTADYQCSIVTPPTDTKHHCADTVTLQNKDIIQSDDYQKKRYFWFAAPTGLLYRVSNNQNPTGEPLGSNYYIAQLKADQFYQALNNSRSDNQKYQVIYNEIATNPTAASSYLQYRFWSKFQDYSKHTGGYVLGIKHTKCRRINGNSFDDPVVQARGKIEYKIVPGGEDPNTTGSYATYELKPSDDKGNAEAIMSQAGNVWMKIYNKEEEYKESYGKYKVQMFTSEPVGSFTRQILTPLFKLLQQKVQDASTTVFKNMTCYGGKSNCTNFFTYIKAVLILYVMTFGAMFLLGMVQISHQDLLIRIVKIAIVSGLMNDSTFEFFNTYIFDIVRQFSDGVMSNMAGYSMFTSTSTDAKLIITNPFMFLDAVMSKILFSKTFSAQLFSFLSMGMSGLIYFVITFIAVAIVVITALRAIAVYIMAFMATAVLIGLAPLFLTFMLFDFTRYLFENWVRFTIRYMVEPLILMAGIIIMTQLFTIYLDFALGFSVCWKCALPFKFPIPNIGGLNPAWLDMPIFCISWFAPWGMDYRSGLMGVNMQHFIALIIIAYGMYGYVEFSGKMVAKLTEGGGPLATYMGATMSSSMGQSALGKVGLDQKTRGEITGAAKERLKARNKAIDQAKKDRNKLNTNKRR
ncbi:type IV secretion system protein [Candidatus Tisiphia endosymbiont of Nemotelus uliginosus]|uniref:type IV secretion system protein n=1 Tax=Candidatus Tisiphia endosymbiont of Nemotelus uliginosus TaxID=3077926 RepID=UPI0035C907AF